MRNIHLLAEALRTLDGRGLQSVEHPDVAAEQLTWLVVAAPLNQLTLQAGVNLYSPHDLAAQGVTTFLSRYASP